MRFNDGSFDCAFTTAALIALTNMSSLMHAKS